MFRYIHIYREPSTTKLDLSEVSHELANFFPTCEIDLRDPFLQRSCENGRPLDMIAETLATARISEIKSPYCDQEKRRKKSTIDEIMYEKSLILDASLRPTPLVLYDGFMLQRAYAASMPSEESSTEHAHVIFDPRLTCTFSEEDWRYHARAVICGTPSIISSTGIVEAPAKNKEFYLPEIPLEVMQSNKERLAGRESTSEFVGYNDSRINSIVIGYILQALFFFITDGYPFCHYKNCRLYNAHWQSDLLRTQITIKNLCKRHRVMLSHYQSLLSG
ncbi:MAG: DUF6775 family putative metallopeptidase [Candidatus Nitrosopolaris sp.]